MSNVQEYMNALYQIVDRRDTEALAELLHDDICFRFGNADPVSGKSAVKDINLQFFQSISSMSHTIYGYWQDESEYICNGQVNYVRLDGSHFSAQFATILSVQDGLITDYRIYADLSEL